MYHHYGSVRIPRNQSLPAIGGSYSCPFISPTAVGVEFFRFIDLDARPELAVLVRENKSVTTSDLMALFFEYERRVQDPYLFQKFEIVNNTDITINVIDPVTNQTVETVSAKYIEWIHTDTIPIVMQLCLAMFQYLKTCGFRHRCIIRNRYNKQPEAIASRKIDYERQEHKLKLPPLKVLG